ncbi:hypothetical protein FLM48_11090 [Shewanella sp. Scap07]|uniref:hypothetical protein n=1 Tax=Shewanella sp. Scap07 TaxID=2589987 RepID=UPI0015B91055|nr:hypothetical protein [Shewanella sp. Scap07]QLE85575.1 hypothetical protein FLM48_11090 [Shewanella sp. Scap07]
MQEIINNLDELRRIVQKGQNASLINAAPIAKEASVQTVVLLSLYAQKLNELERRVRILECR